MLIKYFYHLVVVLSTALTQFLIIRTFKLYVGVHELGSYLLALGYITPIAIIFNFGLKNFYLSNEIEPEDKIVMFNIKLLGLLLLLITSLFFRYIFNYSEYWIFFFVLGYKLIESILDLTSAILLKSNDNKSLAFFNFLRFFGVSSFLFLFSHYEPMENNDLFLAIILFITVVTFFEQKRCFVFSGFYLVNFIQIFDVLKVSLFLAGSSLIATLMVNAPRIYVGEKLGEETLAIFGILMFVVTMVNMFATVLVQLNISKLSKLFRENRYLFKSFVNKRLFPSLILVAMVIYVSGSFFGQNLLFFLFGQGVEYDQVLIDRASFISSFSFLLCFINLVFISSGNSRLMMALNLLSLFLLLFCFTFFDISSLKTAMDFIASIYTFNVLIGFYLTYEIIKNTEKLGV